MSAPLFGVGGLQVGISFYCHFVCAFMLDTVQPGKMIESSVKYQDSRSPTSPEQPVTPVVMCLNSVRGTGTQGAKCPTGKICSRLCALRKKRKKIPHYGPKTFL